MAQASTGHAEPSNFSWTASFPAASTLLPGPQLEHRPSRFNLQTSQFIPHAPVVMAQAFQGQARISFDPVLHPES